jgi:hypothetical protein
MYSPLSSALALFRPRYVPALILQRGALALARSSSGFSLCPYCERAFRIHPRPHPVPCHWYSPPLLPLLPLIKPTMRDPRLGLYSLSSRAHSYTLAVAPFYAGAARPKRVESNKHLGIYIHSFNLYGPVGVWIWLWLWLVLS